MSGKLIMVCKQLNTNKLSNFRFKIIAVQLQRLG